MINKYMKKICTSCKEEKNINEFYIQKYRKNGSSYCKSCFNNFCIERWKKRKIKAIEYLGNECVDCKTPHPKYPSSVYEFHHLDPSIKDYTWVKLRLKSWDKIKDELNKCVLLCANCHRIRHHNENLDV